MKLEKLAFIAMGCLIGMIITVGIVKISPYWADPREYQIRLEPERAYLYDGNRLVGSVPYNDKDGGLDSLILMDNL